MTIDYDYDHWAESAMDYGQQSWFLIHTSYFT